MTLRTREGLKDNRANVYWVEYDSLKRGGADAGGCTALVNSNHPFLKKIKFLFT